MYGGWMTTPCRAAIPGQQGVSRGPWCKPCASCEPSTEPGAWSRPPPHRRDAILNWHAPDVSTRGTLCSARVGASPTPGYHCCARRFRENKRLSPPCHVPDGESPEIREL